MDEQQISILLSTDNFLNTLEKLLNNYDNKLDEYNKTLANINNRLDSIDKRLDALEKNNVKSSDITSITKDISTIKTTLNSLKTRSEKNPIVKPQEKSKAHNDKLPKAVFSKDFSNQKDEYSNKSDFKLGSVSNVNFKKDDYTKKVDKKDKK